MQHRCVACWRSSRSSARGSTTIAFAIARNEFGGANGIGLLVIVIGFLVDIGVVGGGARGRR